MFFKLAVITTPCNTSFTLRKRQDNPSDALIHTPNRAKIDKKTPPDGEQIPSGQHQIIVY